MTVTKKTPLYCKRPSPGQLAEKVRERKLVDLNKKIKTLEPLEKQYSDKLKALDEEITELTLQRDNATTSTEYQEAVAALTIKQKERKNTQIQLTRTSTALKAARSEREGVIYNYEYAELEEKKNTGKGSSKGDGTADNSDVDKKKPGISLQWQYNPPMVRAAYLNPTGVQQQDGSLPVSSPGAWTDAMKAWKLSQGSKGVIQMSRSYPYYGTVSNFKALPVTESSTIYGFKFLYNPTTVTMSWGVGSEVDIAKFAAGSFRASPITDAAMNSTVTFSIILNRMLDMNVVTNQGLRPGDFYPQQITTTDAIGIYEKGTMHDLEYLFKAVNGKDVEYNSSLNGKTADLGWLNSFPVELHLGSGLRYLVRVTQINVEHKIFNERMVPIFSTVDFICKRLPDLPSTEETSSNRNFAMGGVSRGEYTK